MNFVLVCTAFSEIRPSLPLSSPETYCRWPTLASDVDRPVHAGSVNLHSRTSSGLTIPHGGRSRLIGASRFVVLGVGRQGLVFDCDQEANTRTGESARQMWLPGIGWNLSPGNQDQMSNTYGIPHCCMSPAGPPRSTTDGCRQQTIGRLPRTGNGSGCGLGPPGPRARAGYAAAGGLSVPAEHLFWFRGSCLQAPSSLIAERGNLRISR
jgi:hypothetical protein